MRTRRIALAWVATAFIAAATSACATMGTTGRYAQSTDGQSSSRVPSWRVERDSIAAQAIADEVGPRVSVRVTTEHYAGSRQVEANFRMYDDAYVIVGHLDAGGRMRVVFPTSPGDDGFVKANKIYHVPSFFAGFGDEYRWRAESRTRFQSIASRRDSYDGGLGYVFVIASWRPMRLDRITDGSKWQSYEVADINYLDDPREAIEELGGLLAGDNREAYTIEYARYSSTNFGTFSYSSFNRCHGVGFGLGYWPVGWSSMGRYGYGSFGFSPYSFSPYGFSSFGGGFGCGSGYAYAPRYAYNYARPFGNTPAPPIIRPPVVLPPAGPPIFRRPRFPGDSASGTIVTRRPRTEPATGTTSAQQDDPNAAFRRRGLVAEDAGPVRRGDTPRRRPVDDNSAGDGRRPGLHEMVDIERIREASRGSRAESRYPRGGSRTAVDESGSSAGGSYRGGVSQPRSDDGASDRRTPGGAMRGGDGGGRSREYDRPSGSRSEPRSESPRSGGAREAPAPRSEPRSEPARAEPRSAPTPPPARPEPSSGERRKPGV